MLNKNQRRKLLLDEVYVYSLVTRAYNEGFAKPYSESALQHPYSKRLLEVGSDTELQKEVLVYLILYDELHFPGFDNFVLLDKNGKQLYPKAQDRGKAPLYFDVKHYITLLPSLRQIIESCCKNDSSCNEDLSFIRRESEHLKRNSTTCFLAYISMYSLNEINLEYNEFKINYCYQCAELYTKITELLQVLDCNILDEIEILLEQCTQKLMLNGLPENMAHILCVLTTNTDKLVEEKLPRDIVEIYHRCNRLYNYKYRIMSFLENAISEKLDIKIGSLRKIKLELHGIKEWEQELNNLKTKIREEHIDEDYVSTLISIVFDKVPWVKPTTYKYALELLGKESISAFREWFWSSIDELLSTDSTEKINRIVNEIERGVNEILNARDLKYRLEKYGKVILLISLPLSIASALMPSTSIISLGVSLLSVTPEIIWYIERNRIKRRYSWLMPDAYSI